MASLLFTVAPLAPIAQLTFPMMAVVPLRCLHQLRSPPFCNSTKRHECSWHQMLT